MSRGALSSLALPVAAPLRLGESQHLGVAATCLEPHGDRQVLAVPSISRAGALHSGWSQSRAGTQHPHAACPKRDLGPAMAMGKWSPPPAGPPQHLTLYPKGADTAAERPPGATGTAAGAPRENPSSHPQQSPLGCHRDRASGPSPSGKYSGRGTPVPPVAPPVWGESGSGLYRSGQTGICPTWPWQR